MSRSRKATTLSGNNQDVGAKEAKAELVKGKANAKVDRKAVGYLRPGLFSPAVFSDDRADVALTGSTLRSGRRSADPAQVRLRTAVAEKLTTSDYKRIVEMLLPGLARYMATSACLIRSSWLIPSCG